MFDPGHDSTSSPDYHRKIVDVQRLAHVLERIRRNTSGEGRSKTIVQCHGCFDIVHPGHIRYLRFARQQGDVLIVSITGDADIDKGEQRPYIPQELRAENLAALQFVDYVVIDPNPTACAVLERIRPDVYVKGREYATSDDPSFLSERRVVESHGGRVIFSSGQVVFSSSRLIEAMPHPADLAHQRLGLLCRRHGIDRGELARLLDSARDRRVLVVGDTLVERYVLCDATDIAGESPMMSLEQLDSRDYLGGAAQLAAHICELGGHSVLVTRLGEDDASAWAAGILADAGVEVRCLRRRPETPIKTRYLVDDHKLFKVNRTAVRPLDSIGEQEAAQTLMREAATADASIIYDCGYGTITPGLLHRLGGPFRRRVPVLVAGSAEPHGNLEAFRDIDLLCVSERQLRAAVGDLESGLSAVAYRVIESTRAKRMLVLLGKRGLVTFDRRSHDPASPSWKDRLSSEHLPMSADRVLDQLGSIEALLATATLALASGASLMQAAYLGAAVSAIQTDQLGLAPIGVDAIHRFLGRRPELSEEVQGREFRSDLRDESSARLRGLQDADAGHVANRPRHTEAEVGELI